jgi:hypothetical protein
MPSPIAAGIAKQVIAKTLAELPVNQMLSPIVAAQPGAISPVSLSIAEKSEITIDYAKNTFMLTIPNNGEVDASSKGAMVKLHSDTGTVEILDNVVRFDFDNDHKDSTGAQELSPRGYYGHTFLGWIYHGRLESIALTVSGEIQISFEGQKPFVY